MGDSLLGTSGEGSNVSGLRVWALKDEKLHWGLGGQCCLNVVFWVRAQPNCSPTPPGPEPLPPKGLQYLVLLSHAHSRQCSLVPGLRGPGGQDGGLVWECSAGHTFSWEPSLSPTPPEVPKQTSLPRTSPRSWSPKARSGQEPAGRSGERGCGVGEVLGAIPRTTGRKKLWKKEEGFQASITRDLISLLPFFLFLSFLSSFHFFFFFFPFSTGVLWDRMGLTDGG